MKEKVFAFMKGVYKSMANKTAEVIDAAKCAFIDIQEYRENKISNIITSDERRSMESDKLISSGISTIIVGVGIALIGANRMVKGRMMRKEI